MADRDQLARRVQRLLKLPDRIGMKKEEVCGSLVCLATEIDVDDVIAVLPEDWKQELNQWLQQNNIEGGFFVPRLPAEREAALRKAMSALSDRLSA